MQCITVYVFKDTYIFKPNGWKKKYHANQKKKGVKGSSYINFRQRRLQRKESH